MSRETLTDSRVVRIPFATMTDSIDGAESPPGTATILNNLIPSVSTANIWNCVDEPFQFFNFNNLAIVVANATSSAGQVACFKVVGNYIYGMVQYNPPAGGLTRDIPFALDITNIGSPVELFVYGTAYAGTGTSTTGALPSIFTNFPPNMAQVGTKLAVAHTGFTISGFYFAYFDITNPLLPTWSVSQLNVVGSITALGTLTGGSGYVSATYDLVPLTGGTGSNASATVVVSGGIVVEVILAHLGINYVAGDTLSASNTHLGGSGTGFSIKVAAVQATAFINLTYPPAWVVEFYDRLWLGVNVLETFLGALPPPQPSVIFTDIGAFGVTNASQALTFGDYILTVGAAKLGLNNQLGGTIQSLMIFKSSEYILQVTGDAALNNLSVNSVPLATGTLVSKTIIATPNGLGFVSPEGFRVMDFTANVQQPLGLAGTGVSLPFINGGALFKLDIADNVLGIFSSCACYNCGVIKFGAWYYPEFSNTVSSLEFNYDVNRKIWYSRDTAQGPIPFVIDRWMGNGFIFADLVTQSPIAPGHLYADYAIPPNTAISKFTPAYTGNWNAWTTVQALTPEMHQFEIIELRVMMSAPNSTYPITVAILDQDANVIASTTFTCNSATTPSTTGLYPRLVKFSAPVVVTRFAVKLTGANTAGLQLGDLWVRLRDLGYVQELPG